MKRASTLAALLLGTLLTIFTSMAVLGTSAQAHTVVVGSIPAADTVLDEAPEQASVTFNEPLQDSFAALTVTGPDGAQWQQGGPVIDGSTISVPLKPLTLPGDYTVAYRVISADSHPVTGTLRFTLDAAVAQNATTPAPATTAASSTAAPEPEPGIGAWPFVAAAVVLVAGGVAFALRRRA
jgi:methionine-rich copper-binding protein CopC